MDNLQRELSPASGEGRPVPFFDLIQLGDLSPTPFGQSCPERPVSFFLLVALGRGTAHPSEGSGNAKGKDKELEG